MLITTQEMPRSFPHINYPLLGDMRHILLPQAHLRIHEISLALAAVMASFNAGTGRGAGRLCKVSATQPEAETQGVSRAALMKLRWKA